MIAHNGVQERDHKIQNHRQYAVIPDYAKKWPFSRFNFTWVCKKSVFLFLYAILDKFRRGRGHSRDESDVALN